MPYRNNNNDLEKIEEIRKLKGLNIRKDDQHSRLGVITRGLNPKVLSGIFREAEMPGDLQRLMEIYKKVEKYDGKIQGLVEKRRKAPTRFPTKIRRKYPDHEKSSQVAQEVDILINSIDIKRLMRRTINGILWGVNLMENTWVKTADDRIIFKEPIPISSSRYGQFNELFGQGDPRWGELYIKSGISFNDRIFVKDQKDYKIYKAIYEGEKGFYDLAGIMRPVCKWYLIKYFAYQYWIEFDETYGFPTTVVTIPKEDYSEFKEEISEFLHEIGRNKFGILFDGMDYKVHAQQSAGQVDFFRELIKKVNDEISFTILGHNLSEKSAQGSYASNVVGYDMDTDLIIDDAEFVDQCINENLIKNYIRFNYQDLPEDFVEFYTNTPERKDWTKVRQKWELAAKLGLKGVSKKQIEEELEIDFAEEDEDSLDLIWQPRNGNGEEEENEESEENEENGDENTGGEHPDEEKRKEERTDGGSVADDDDDEGNSIKK